jgi:hypothetical protein
MVFVTDSACIQTNEALKLFWHRLLITVTKHGASRS